MKRSTLCQIIAAIVWPVAALAQPFADAESLLDELETADAELRRLSAGVRYVRTFDLAGDRQIRDGMLYFQTTPGEADRPPQRRFAIEFRSLILGTRKEDQVQVYIFDGEWLLEKWPQKRHAIKRQVVPAGESFDPLRIGEGPMPIPIGQRKADILARYDAVLVSEDDGLHLDPSQEWSEEEEAEAEALRKTAKGCVQVMLTPRPERADQDDFTQIRLWYSRGPEANARLLPRMARTVNQSGDVAVVRLFNTKINERADVPGGAFDVRIPEGWDADVIAWQEPAPKRLAPPPAPPPDNTPPPELP